MGDKKRSYGFRINIFWFACRILDGDGTQVWTARHDKRHVLSAGQAVGVAVLGGDAGSGGHDDGGNTGHWQGRAMSRLSRMRRTGIRGRTPNYCDKDAYPAHKGGAMVAALGCMGWAMSVTWWPTVLTITMVAAYLAVIEAYKLMDSVWYVTRGKTAFHPLYWAEVAGFADVFGTYFAFAN